MSFWETNISFLQENYPKVYLSMIKDQVINNDVSVSISQNQEGEPNCKIRIGKREVFLHSNYDPRKEAVRWIEQLENKEIVVVLGLGMGYHVEMLLKLQPQVKVFIVEPCWDVFRALIYERDISSFIDTERVSIILESNPENAALELFKQFKVYILDTMIWAAYPSYKSFSESYFVILKKSFTEIVRTAHVNLSTAYYFQNLWLLNFVENTRIVHKASDGGLLTNLFSDLPCIIVSAGPSLDKNIHLLKTIRDKAVIIAGGSSIGILNRHGIKPHFWVAFDGSPEMKDIFDNGDFDNVNMVYTNRLYYKITRDYPCDKFIFTDFEDLYSSWFFSTFNQKNLSIPSAQTVAGTAIDLAVILGCSTVILVGQDLAYPNLQMHAKGAAHMIDFTEEFASKPERFILTEDIYGNPIYTIRQFLAIKSNMDQKMRAYKQIATFINATEGGIGLDEAVNQPLNQAIEKYFCGEDREIRQRIKEQAKSKIAITEQKINTFFKKIVQQSRELKSVCIKRHKLALKAKEILTAQFFDNSKYVPIAIKINEFQDKIDQNEFYNQLVLPAINYTLGIQNVVTERKLRDSITENDKNLIRIELILNQTAEIVGKCNFIQHVLTVPEEKWEWEQGKS